MKEAARNLSFILFLTGLVLPFNNCDYADTSLFQADQNNLSSSSLNIALDLTGTRTVTVDEQIFMISGSCDAGTYPTSEIFWTIHTLNGTPVTDSYVAGGLQFLSACVNGRFTAQVRAPCPGLINTAAGCFGVTQSYQLRFHLVGITADGTQPTDGQAISAPLTLSP